jgi:ATP-dependent Lon protease
MPGKGEVHLTGQMGDILKESAAAAFSYLRSRASRFGLAEDFLNHVDVHVHLPKGAMPKDGPAMGLSILVSLLSLFKGIPVRADVALTGEITLRGNVLPVGGIKEKLLAAHRAGIKRVIIPERNVKDLQDVPDQARREMEIISVKRMDELLGLALTELPEALVGVLEAKGEPQPGNVAKLPGMPPPPPDGKPPEPTTVV